LGVIKKIEEQHESNETKSWNGSMETYSKALEIVKELAEKPITIKVIITVPVSIEKAWKHWTSPEHITKWNNPSEANL
jgi:hypothetical protein